MCGPAAPGSHFRASPTDLGFEPVSLADDIHVLTARNTSWPAPGNIVVVADADGLALIDCGFGSEQAYDELTGALEKLGYRLDAVHTALITHPHPDHSGGARILPEDARVLGPAGAGPVVGDPVATAELIFPTVVRALAPERSDLDITEHFRDDCGVIDQPVEVTALDPGETVAVGCTRWLAVPTPGHEDGMLSYVEPELGIVVCSDLLAARGTAIPWYAPGGGGTTAYLDGLRRLGDFQLGVGVRGHGSLLDGADEITDAVTSTAALIQQRTEKVLKALEDRPLSFAELEATIYPERVYDVIPWAASVLATHLLEGIQDGTLRRQDELFAAVPRARSVCG